MSSRSVSVLYLIKRVQHKLFIKQAFVIEESSYSWFCLRRTLCYSQICLVNWCFINRLYCICNSKFYSFKTFHRATKLIKSSDHPSFLSSSPFFCGCPHEMWHHSITSSSTENNATRIWRGILIAAKKEVFTVCEILLPLYLLEEDDKAIMFLKIIPCRPPSPFPLSSPFLVLTILRLLSALNNIAGIPDGHSYYCCPRRKRQYNIKISNIGISNCACNSFCLLFSDQ